ncbi:amino acid/polyamine transporter I [Podospora appendiculata]|uniref:Amino acid/polyamine transporter I n=1 Tax=Podospora appendiculata TaxID=314037 RepID=A0AAE1CB55_9PEZI|nr:amino acid/polyamine transporter I [Podospora appendiculata]
MEFGTTATVETAAGELESHKPNPMSPMRQQAKFSDIDVNDEDDDDAHLQRLGKRPLLNRSFGFMSILGFSCSALLSWEGVLVTSVPGLLNGGPAGVIWGFLLNWIGTMSVYAAMAELASIAPTAGGQYHWVSMLAPARCRNFLAYITAWLTVTAWQAMAVSTGYIVATLLQGMVVLVQPTSSYIPESWHTILILWAAMVFAVVMNSTTSRALARFEGLVLVLHLAGFFCVLVPLGGWSGQGLSFLVGFPTVATALVGADCAVHMAEEIQCAALVVPRALMYTIFINGSLAFAMIIALMFCLDDLPSALAAAETMFYPFLQVFLTAVGSATGACIVAGVILAVGLASSVSVYASASRMLWFSTSTWSGNSLPVTAIVATLTTTMLLSLIALGSKVALSALLSLVIAALSSSYLLVCSLLLWRRTTGAMQPHISGSAGTRRVPVLDPDDLSWGVWRVPEPLGTINNVFAVLYSAFLLFWSFWPQTDPTAPETANWSVLVFGAVVVFRVLWYVVRAKRHFKGPIRETS